MSQIDFSQINKSSSKSFLVHKNLIKKLGKGETVPCTRCGTPLMLDVSAEGDNGIFCKNGCTVIMLEL